MNIAQSPTLVFVAVAAGIASLWLVLQEVFLRYRRQVGENRLLVHESRLVRRRHGCRMALASPHRLWTSDGIVDDRSIHLG